MSHESPDSPFNDSAESNSPRAPRQRGTVSEIGWRISILVVALLIGLVAATGFLNLLVLGWYGARTAYGEYLHLLGQRFGPDLPSYVRVGTFVGLIVLQVANAVAGAAAMYWLVRFRSRGRIVALGISWFYLGLFIVVDLATFVAHPFSGFPWPPIATGVRYIIIVIVIFALLHPRVKKMCE